MLKMAKGVLGWIWAPQFGQVSTIQSIPRRAMPTIHQSNEILILDAQLT